jgi:hypothetical protein
VASLSQEGQAEQIQMTKGLRLTEEQLAAMMQRTKVAQVKAGKVGKFKPLVPTEHQEQVKLIQWCNAHPVADCIFSSQAGVRTTIGTANKAKAEGMRKGVPDLFLPVPAGGFHGLFIELKRVKNAKPSKEQQDWIEFLNKQGYFAIVCYGADEAIAVIQRYLTSK